jgi:hypothetical protein
MDTHVSVTMACAPRTASIAWASSAGGSPGGGGPLPLGPCGEHIDAFIVNSRREYFVVDGAAVGRRLYTDRPALCWSQLPSLLAGQRYISTPCDDYASTYWDLMRFTVRKPSVIVVLSEASCRRPPPDWLLRDGYRRLVTNTIARRAMSAA